MDEPPLIEGNISRHLSDAAVAMSDSVLIEENVGGIFYYLCRNLLDETGSIEGSIKGTSYLMKMVTRQESTGYV